MCNYLILRCEIIDYEDVNLLKVMMWNYLRLRCEVIYG